MVISGQSGLLSKTLIQIFINKTRQMRMSVEVFGENKVLGCRST